MHGNPELASALLARTLAAAPLMFAGVLLALDPAQLMLEFQRALRRFAGGPAGRRPAPVAAGVRAAVRSIGLALILWTSCYLAGFIG